MSKQSELHNFRHSFSGDASIGIQSRSGDNSSNAGCLFDFVAHTASPEEQLIAAEEERERQQRISLSKLLKLYFKYILTADELKFLSACMRSDKTPREVGKAFDMDYFTTIESINRKHSENKQKLIQAMRRAGYALRSDLEFLPELNKYFKKNEKFRAWRNSHRDEINAKKRAEYQNGGADKIRERAVQKSRRYYQENREKVLEYKKKYYYTPQRQEYVKAYRERKKAEMQEYQRAYRAKKQAERQAN